MTDARTGGDAFQSMRRVALVGAVIAAVFFGGLGGWAAMAPLDSAALAPGVLSVEGNRKSIQHLEGGIVAEIAVREGDRVAAGQSLVRLEETHARAALEQLQGRHYAALALEARLLAERDSLDAIVFPLALTAESDNQEVAEAIAGEQSIFDARRRSLEGQAAIIEQRIAQYQKEIEGLQGQIDAETSQLALIEKELAAHSKLAKQKLVGMQRLIELQRDRAEIRGSRARHVASIARVEQNITEQRLEILELDTARVNEVVESLREAQARKLDTAERIRAAEDVLARTHLRAALDGVVVDLRVHTVGGVVAPGETLMDIVPIDERLIVQAQVTPEDIDSVHAGLEAQVAITAFSRRNVPPIDGTVVSVSADRLTDSRTGQPFFLARIALPQDPYEGQQGLSLFPGMQAEVMIVTGERTALDYLIRPAMRSFGRALRED